MSLLRVFFIAIIMMAGTINVTAQTLDEVVTKHIEAIGGMDAWKKVSSLKFDGVLSVQGTDVTMSVVQLHKKGMRQDITLQGMTGYQIVTPTKGWTFMPFQGQTEVSSMSEEDLKQAQNELDSHGSLIEYKEKGHKAELAGKENLSGAECYKIVVTLNSGKKETMFIDAKTYYVVRTLTKQKMNGQEQDVETNYSSFEKTPEGIVMPKTLTLPYGTMTLTKVEVNPAVDEKVFNPEYKAEKMP